MSVQTYNASVWMALYVTRTFVQRELYIVHVTISQILWATVGLLK